MNWYLKALSGYFDFSGRARRKEYCWYMIINIIILLIVASIDNLLFSDKRPILTTLFFVSQIIPFTAVTVRRLHDRNMSGWWYLISFIPSVGSFILLIINLLSGDEGENDYGPDPREE